MARRHGHWATLGIDRTHDERAIKRAYAAKLKTISVGADPKAFIALRAAFDGARNEAQWIQPPEQFVVVDDTQEAAPESNQWGEGAVVLQSLAEEDLNPKQRALRYAPMGDLRNKASYKSRPKIRVKPLGAASDADTDKEEPPKTRIKRKKPDAPETDAAGIDGNDSNVKIRFKAAPKTRPKTEAAAVELNTGSVADLAADDYSDAGQDDAVVASPWDQAWDDHNDIDTLIARIASLVKRGGSADVDEAALHASFTDLLAVPALDNIGRREEVETRIASIALDAGERGYYLVLLAHWHFGWHQRATEYGLQWPINEVVEMAPAISRLRDLQANGNNQGSDNNKNATFTDQNSYRWLMAGPPPKWNPQYWMRRYQVANLVDRIRQDSPALIDIIGRDRIAEWQDDRFSTKRLMMMVVLLVFASAEWALGLSKAAGKEFPLSPWVTATFFAATIFAALVMTERAAVQRDVDQTDYWRPDIHDGRQLLALALLGGLTLLFGMLPPNPWLTLGSAVLAAALLYLTGNPLLRIPERDRSFLYVRRITVGAFMITCMHSFGASKLLQYQIIVPATFFLWAAARMHGSINIWFDRQVFIRRWIIHLGLLVGAVAMLVLLFKLPAETKIPYPFWFVYLAMMVVVIHDLAAQREAEIPGTQFLIIPLFTGAMVVVFPIGAMMVVVILRTLPILYHAYQGRRLAAQNGWQWRDSGDGYNSGTSFSEISFFGIGLKTGSGGRSVWFWIWIVFMVLQLFRLIPLLFDLGAEPQPQINPPAIENYLENRPLIDPLTGKYTPEFQKILDDANTAKQGVAPDSVNSLPPIAPTINVPPPSPTPPPPIPTRPPPQ